MKVSAFFWLFLLHYVSAHDNASIGLTANSIRKQPERYRYVKNLMEDFRNEKWNDDESQCVELLARIIKNVENSTLWATWIWDAMQNPVGHLYGSKNNYGNYDECMEFPWEKIHPDLKTQYCMMDIHLSGTDFELDKVDFFGNVNNYIRAQTKNYLKFNTLKWGVCAPDACNPDSVAKFANVLYRQTYLALAVGKPNISVSQCYRAEENEASHGIGYYFTVSFAVLFVVFTLLATWIVNSHKYNQRYSDFFKAFHIPKNIDSLMKFSDKDIRCMYGMRVISSVFVMAIHVFWIIMCAATTNALRLDKDYVPIRSMILTMEMIVDTFLFMSGLLLIKGLLTEGSTKFNFLTLIVKRYFRIAWLMGLMILVITNVLHNAARGPMVKEAYTSEIDACRRNWWTSLLMIQNVYDTKNMCHAVGWSSDVDFHVTIIGILISWVYLQNEKAGLLFFIICFITSIVTPAVLIYSNDRQYGPLKVDFRLTDNYREIIFNSPSYIATQFRSAPHFAGMALGYIMFKYNPASHRNVITKKKSLSGLCVTLLVFLGLFIICDTMYYRKYSPIEAGLFMSLKRIVWSALLASIIILCEYGTLPLINDFLGWSAWVPLSKLSYGSYLVHPIFVYYTSSVSRSPSQYDFLVLILTTFGLFVLSNIISLFLWTFFDAPMQNIVSLLCRTSRNNKVNKEVNTKLIEQDIGKYEDRNDKKIR